jgi:hypothetical protein
MRGFAGILGAWVMCGGMVLAQAPDAVPPAMGGVPDSLLAPSPVLDAPAPDPAPSGSLYVEVDALLRWFKPVCLTPAVLSVGNPAAPVPGAVGQPGTQVVVGDAHKFEFGLTPGVALTLGWERGDGAFGIRVSGFVMEEAAASQGFRAGPNGAPATYLTFQAPDNTPQALPFTVPGVVTGGVEAVGSTKIWGTEADLTLPFTVECGGHGLSGTFLVGGRYLDLTDRVRVSDALSLVADPSAFAFGADEFITRNQFAGPEVGATLGLTWGRFALEYTTKLAAGLTHQVRIIEGSPLLAGSVVSPLLVPGPLLALPSNIGRETAWRVTLVPEVGVRSRLALTPGCSLTIGYSLLYWNKVLCPGDQMDPHANVSQLPFRGPVTGPAVPAPLFEHTDYFAQGLDLGVQFTF